MKKVIVLLVVFIAMNRIVAQNCLPDGITFTTQDQIDNFQFDYPGCTIIDGDVIIGSFQYSGNITNLNGLSVIVSVWHSLTIKNNTNLESLQGLDNLTTVGEEMVIYKNHALTNLVGLGNLTTIVGNFTIENNSNLTNLTGLENLTSIIGSLTIENNANLTTMTGMDNLNQIWGDFIINYNNNLSSIDGFENLTTIDLGLNILSNNLLTTFNGFDNLNSAQYILIESNNSLLNLNGLESISTVSTGISIHDNNALNNIMGLEGLSSLGGGGLGIYSNPNLTSLAGIENIDALSIDEVWLYNNDVLSDCDVQTICDLLDNSNVILDIHDNGPGCSYIYEIEAACLTSVDERNAENGITIIPNPSKDKITISSPAITEITNLSIFNVSGEKVMERQLTNTNTQIDISALPRGVYFVRLQNEKMVEVRKLVKD